MTNLDRFFRPVIMWDNIHSLVTFTNAKCIAIFNKGTRCYAKNASFSFIWGAKETQFTNLIRYNRKSVVLINQCLRKPKILPVLSTLDSIELPEYQSVPYICYTLKLFKWLSKVTVILILIFKQLKCFTVLVCAHFLYIRQWETNVKKSFWLPLAQCLWSPNFKYNQFSLASLLCYFTLTLIKIRGLWRQPGNILFLTGLSGLSQLDERDW